MRLGLRRILTLGQKKKKAKTNKKAEEDTIMKELVEEDHVESTNQKDADMAADSGPPVEDEVMEGEGNPGVRVVELQIDVATRLAAQGKRWLLHFEKVAGVEAEMSVDPKSEMPQDVQIDPTIEDKSTSEQLQQFRPGLHVSVASSKNQPLRHLKGRFGRILERATVDESWQVRLADGTQQILPSVNLIPRDVAYGEMWIRTRKSVQPVSVESQDPERASAEWLLYVLSVALTCRSLELTELTNLELKTMHNFSICEVPGEQDRKSVV